MTMEGYGVSKKDKPHYFDPQKWKQQKLEAMTDAAVRQKNAAFVAAHRSWDTRPTRERSSGAL